MTAGPLYYVVCEDDKIRHPFPFGCYADAVQYAEHGHACTAATSHRVARIGIGTRAIRRIGSQFWGPLRGQINPTNQPTEAT